MIKNMPRSLSQTSGLYCLAQSNYLLERVTYFIAKLQKIFDIQKLFPHIFGSILWGFLKCLANGLSARLHYTAYQYITKSNYLFPRDT